MKVSLYRAILLLNVDDDDDMFNDTLWCIFMEYAHMMVCTYIYDVKVQSPYNYSREGDEKKDSRITTIVWKRLALKKL